MAKVKKSSKTKVPKLVTFVVIGQFEDGKARHFVMCEQTRNAILNIIVMLEGSIKVYENPIDGIVISKNK